MDKEINTDTEINTNIEKNSPQEEGNKMAATLKEYPTLTSKQANEFTSRQLRHKMILAKKVKDKIDRMKKEHE
ncbi:MAG: hypothetical protein WA125_09115 [Desulfosporosinus sp.]